jgi:hypothetical protein
MPGSITSIQRRARVLLASMALVALAGLCAWGGWAAVQPELSTFLLKGARDIRYERVGPGMQGLLFNYDGSVVAQTLGLYARTERRGWQAGQAPSREDCEGQCLLGQVTLVFTRRSLFDLIYEVATVEQRGIGPYRVRVVLRRCVQLPRIGCWPPG